MPGEVQMGVEEPPKAFTLKSAYRCWQKSQGHSQTDLGQCRHAW